VIFAVFVVGVLNFSPLPSVFLNFPPPHPNEWFGILKSFGGFGVFSLRIPVPVFQCFLLFFPAFFRGFG